MSVKLPGPIYTAVPVILQPTTELEDHPAFYSILTKKAAEDLLEGTAPKTYILWVEKGETEEAPSDQYFLSYKDDSLNVKHRTFSRPSNWFYQNCDPHSEERLVDL